jgi:hypothetical protein
MPSWWPFLTRLAGISKILSIKTFLVLYSLPKELLSKLPNIVWSQTLVWMSTGWKAYATGEFINSHKDFDNKENFARSFKVFSYLLLSLTHSCNRGEENKGKFFGPLYNLSVCSMRLDADLWLTLWQ